MKQRNIYALLVAINDYPNPRHKLDGCINDALAVKDFLTHRCQGLDETTQTQTKLQLKTLFDQEATKANIAEAFRSHLAQAQEDDIAFFYFCGHGAQEICPPQFRYLEPDGKNQSIVCYDSRDPNNPNGYDLADKELAYLISEVSQNNPHFVVAMDCCHSGRGTRSTQNSNTKSRQIETHSEARNLDTFIGYENISPDIQEVKVPKGNHILLSASRNTQTAKETRCEGTQHGVFTYSLLKVLTEAKSPLSYAEIARRIRPLVTNLVSEQHPQLEVNTVHGEASSNQELNKKFLDGQVQKQDDFYTVTYNQNLQKWTIDAGAVHGFPEKSADKIRLSIYAENAQITDFRNPKKIVNQAFVTKVLPEYSVIEFDENSNEIDTIYKAKIEELPIKKIGFWLDCSTEMTDYLKSQFAKENFIYANLVENQEDAVYKISSQNLGNDLKKYRVSRLENTIPLVLDYNYLPENQKDETEQFTKDIEQIAKWSHLKNLNNPDTSFKSDAVSLETYRVLETNENGQITDSELIDPNSDFRFEQAPIDGTKDEEHEYFVDFAMKIKNNSNQPLWCSLLFMSSAFGVDNSLIASEKLEPNAEIWAWDKEVLPIGIGDLSLKFGITQVTETFKLIYSTNQFDSSLFNQDDLLLPENELRAMGKRGKKVGKEGKKVDWATFTQEITVFSQPQPQDIQRLAKNQLLSEGQGIFLSQKENKLQATVQLKSENQLINNKTQTRSTTEKPKNIIPEIFQELDFEYFKFSEGRESDAGLSILELSDIQDETVVTSENPLELEFNYQDLAKNETVLPVVSDGEIVFPVGIGMERENGGTLIKINQLPIFENEDEIQERSVGKSVKLMLQKIKSETLGGNFGYPILAKVKISDDGEELTYLGENQEDCLKIVKKEVEKPENQNVLIFMHGVLGETKDMALSAKKAKYASQSIESQYDLVLTFDYESMNTPLEEVAEQFAKTLRKAGIFDRTEKGEIVKTNVSKVHIVAHSMGGLVARQFIEKNGGNQVIDHLVMVGTPNLGSPWSKIEDLVVMILTAILSKISLAAWAVSPLVLLIKQFDKKWKTLDQLNPKSDFFKGLNAEEAPNSGIPYTIISGNTQEIARMSDEATQEKLLKIADKISGVKFGALDKLVFRKPNDIAVSTESISAKELWETRKQNVEIEEIPCDHVSYFSDKKGLDALAKVFFERVNS